MVRQTDFVQAFPTDDHPDEEFLLENGIETTAVSNDPNDSMNLSEEGSLHEMPIDETDRDSWIVEEDYPCSKDVGIQCDLVDVLSMLAEYQKNANDENIPLYMSPTMTRDGIGMSMTEASALNCNKFTLNCLLACMTFLTDLSRIRSVPMNNSFRSVACKKPTSSPQLHGQR